MAELPATEPIAAAAAPEPVLEARPLTDSPLSVPITPRRKPRGVPGPNPIGLFLFAALSPWLAVLGCAIAVRLGYLDWRYGYQEMLFTDGRMSLAWKLTLLGALTGVAGLVFAGVTAPRKLMGKAMRNLLITAVTAGALWGAGELAGRMAPVHDVATDWAEPITFTDATMKVRGAGANPVDLDPVIPVSSGVYAGRRVAEINAERCAAAKPLVLPRAQAEAFDVARAALMSKGMTLTTENAAEGRLEAVSTSLVYGFKADVAVRIRQDVAGSRVDIRSVSRERQADLGANCRRVTALLDAIRG